MKTCTACGRPLADHGGKAAIQSSEIGPKAADASCCDPQATPRPDSPETAQDTTSGAKQPAAKKRFRVRRRKKLGQFLPARITMRPRPTVERTASDAPRSRRRPVLRFRPKKRAKSQQVASNPPETIKDLSQSEAASDAVEQSPQTAPVEQRTEERKQLIVTPAGQILLWLPIDVGSDAGEQTRQAQVTETQFEQKAPETEQVIAATAKQLELSWPPKATTDAREQFLQAPPVEQRTKERKQLIVTSAGQFLLWLPIDLRAGAREQSHQVHIIETQLEQMAGETEPVIAASASSEQLELSLLSKATTDTGADAPSEITSDAPDKRPRKRRKSLQNRRRTLSQTQPAEDQSAEDGGTDTTLFQTQELAFVPWRSAEPMEAILPAAETAAPKQQDETPPPATSKLEEQAQEPPAPAVEVCSKPEEPRTEPSAPATACSVDKPAENPAALETPLEKAAPAADAKIPPAPVPAAEPLDIPAAVTPTPPLEEQTNAPPAPAAEVRKREEPHTQETTAASAQCNEELTANKPGEKPISLEPPAEQPAFEVYAMIPPAPSEPVPGRTEFTARLQAPANLQSKEPFVEKEPIELVPGFSAASVAPSQPSPEQPKVPEPVAAKTEAAVEETKPASASSPLAKETSIPDDTKSIEREKAAEIGAQTETSPRQTTALEPESDMASIKAAQDDEANKKIEQPPKKKVLVADDDPTLRMLLKMGLEPHGYECLLAENGKAAQAVVQAHHPALILVDLLMPVMDGLSFVQWLRETAKDSTPVLAFTNLDDVKITQQALDSGANAFACKPLRLKELLQTMKELVPA